MVKTGIFSRLLERTFIIFSWISQKGCLQFSLKITHSRPSSLIFLQYLFGLAVIESIKLLPGCAHVTVYLKWPNDIYIKKEDGSLKKVGGILVSSEFTSNKFGVIIGCGINFTNSLPTISIAEHAIDSSVLEMELFFAQIMAKFQELYYELMEQEGNEDVFQIFRERYYSHWLHT